MSIYARSVYLIGSLRNPFIPLIANDLRAAGWDVFDDWHAAGPKADDAWRQYEQARGRTYKQALRGLAADHVFGFDRYHLAMASHAVLVMPAGKSGFMELGWFLGQGKPGYILLDPKVDRWDVMVKFATGVADTVPELIEMLGR